MQEKMTKNTF